MSAIGLVLAAVEANAPVIVHGSPGIGKTSMITAALRREGWHVIVLLGTSMGPEDVAGMPRMVGDDRMAWAPPAWAVEATEAAERAVLVFDEFTQIPHAVQAALLPVISPTGGRRLVGAGTFSIPESVRVVALANPFEEAGSAWPLTPPMANRFIHVDWTLDVDAWINYILTEAHQGQDAAARIAAYIAAQRHCLAPGCPPDGVTASGPWPSPRSWELAIRICRHLPPSEWYNAVAGCVGEAAASSFATWLQKADLPETRAVLNGGLPDTWWTGKRPHQVYAVLASVASAMVADDAAWGLGWPVLAAAAAHGPLDVATAAADLVLRARPNREVEFRYLSPFASLFASLRGEHP